MLIDGKSFFDVLVKNKEEALEKIMSISKINDYRTGNLLDYEYFSKHYQLIAIDLRKEIEIESRNLRQQIILLVNLKMIKQQYLSLQLDSNPEPLSS